MLNEQQIRQFHRDGFLLGPRVLDDEQVDTLRAELMRVIADKDNPDVPQPVLLHSIGGETPIWQIVNIWEASTPYRELVYQPTIAEEAAQLLDAREVRVWHDQIQYKVAGKGGVNFWHQDSLYWPIVTPKNTQVTAWIALDDVDEENGCMWMVPGSQGWGDNIDFLHSLQPTGFRSMPKEHQNRDVQVKILPGAQGSCALPPCADLARLGRQPERPPAPRHRAALHGRADHLHPHRQAASNGCVRRRVAGRRHADRRPFPARVEGRPFRRNACRG